MVIPGMFQFPGRNYDVYHASDTIQVRYCYVSVLDSAGILRILSPWSTRILQVRVRRSLIEE